MDNDNKRRDTEIYVAYEDHEPMDPAYAEKNLLRAILSAALSDIKRPGTDGARAIQYLLNPDEEYLFSFRSICNLLSLDPRQVLLASGVEKRVISDFAIKESERPTAKL